MDEKKVFFEITKSDENANVFITTKNRDFEYLNCSWHRNALFNLMNEIATKVNEKNYACYFVMG